MLLARPEFKIIPRIYEITSSREVKAFATAEAKQKLSILIALVTSVVSLSHFSEQK